MNILRCVINDSLLFNYRECYLLSISSGERIYIGAKPAEVLKYLIEHQGESVTLEQLDGCWQKKGLTINKSSTIQYISKLRKAFRTLDDNAEIITTIKGGGYHIATDILIKSGEHLPLGQSQLDESTNDITLTHSVDISGTGIPVQNQPPAGNWNNLCDDCNDENQESSVKSRSHKSKNDSQLFLHKLLMLLTTVVVLIAICLFFLNKNIKTVDYRFDFNDGGCHFYVDYDSISIDKSIKDSIVNEVRKNCLQKPYIYTTYFDSSDNYTLFACSNNILDSHEFVNCTSIARINNVKKNSE